MRIRKYTEEALEYNIGLGKLEKTLTEIVQEFEQLKDVYNLDLNNEDVLSYYVKKFNEDIKKETDDLLSKCKKDKISIMNRAEVLDERLELEKPSVVVKAGDIHERQRICEDI